MSGFCRRSGRPVLPSVVSSRLQTPELLNHRRSVNATARATSPWRVGSGGSAQRFSKWGSVPAASAPLGNLSEVQILGAQQAALISFRLILTHARV